MCNVRESLGDTNLVIKGMVESGGVVLLWLANMLRKTSNFNDGFTNHQYAS